MSAPVREIRVKISTGKVIRVMTNDLEASAEEIADLYKQRWQIELFFKWIKQNLKIKHMLGTSENAVRIQLFVALIAFLILRAAHATQSAIAHLKRFIRLVHINLMHRRDINNLSATAKPPTNKNQQQIQWELKLC